MEFQPTLYLTFYPTFSSQVCVLKNWDESAKPREIKLIQNGKRKQYAIAIHLFTIHMSFMYTRSIIWLHFASQIKRKALTGSSMSSTFAKAQLFPNAIEDVKATTT